jgi:hypothetical protein
METFVVAEDEEGIGEEYLRSENLKMSELGGS